MDVPHSLASFLNFDVNVELSKQTHMHILTLHLQPSVGDYHWLVVWRWPFIECRLPEAWMSE